MRDRVRIRISRKSDPVLYAAYLQYGPRGFARIARGILDSYAGQESVTLESALNYTLTMNGPDFAPYIKISERTLAFFSRLPERSVAETARSVLTLAFLGILSANTGSPVYTEDGAPGSKPAKKAAKNEKKPARIKNDQAEQPCEEEPEEDFSDLAALFGALEME